jgi:type IV pilus assembly protein PilN
MRGAVPINLASEPFRSDRPIIVLGWAAGAVLGGLFLFLSTMAWIQRSEAADSREALAKARQQLALLNAGQAKLEAEMRDAANAQALEHSLFYNALLQRKGISWTRLFADLEKVMPHNVRLITVRPQVTGDNQVVLDMVVGSQAAEPVIDMLMRLEGSPRFGATAVSSWLPPTQTEPLYRYRVSANYAPAI